MGHMGKGPAGGLNGKGKHESKADPHALGGTTNATGPERPKPLDHGKGKFEIVEDPVSVFGPNLGGATKNATGSEVPIMLDNGRGLVENVADPIVEHETFKTVKGPDQRKGKPKPKADPHTSGGATNATES
jgi:hypothetical protein